MTTHSLTLSIIIPALNEALNLPYLLQDLNWQKNIQFEVIVVDGGSSDETPERCREFQASARYPFTLLETKAGRARQLNAGASQAQSDEFLFLHADCRIRDGSLIHNAHKFLRLRREQTGKPRLCGHFPLKFFSAPGNSNDYYFYECKTYLNKPDCINGDQGFWIEKDYFHQLGHFDESLPFMEDARLAMKITKEDNWITLPGHIETSARRFESEGFTRRQILNSFLCNFNAMGESAYFTETEDIYRQQDQTSRLQLRPFLKQTHKYMFNHGLKTALRRWYKTGEYIAANAWQLAFAYDCRKNRKLGIEPSADDAIALSFYEKYLAHIAHWPATKAITAFLTFFWFYSLFLVR